MGISNHPTVSESESSHPTPQSIWNNDHVQLREYQQKIYERAKKEDVMVVIPTGLGKTYIAARLGAYYLDATALTQKIIFLAPTRPLLTQHWTSHQVAMHLPAESFQMLSGKIPPKKRMDLFTSPQVHFLFMTPQTLRNDLQNGLYTLEHVALLVYDEAHRASGEYAYVPIAQFFHDQNPNGRSLALTASPGADKEKVQEILTNLHIPLDHLEYRDSQDTDVEKYTHEVETVYVGVEMTETMQRIHTTLSTIKRETTFSYIQLYSLFDPSASANEKTYTQGFCTRQIKKLTGLLQGEQGNSRQIRILISTNARLMKLHHFVKNLEAEGLQILLKNLEKTWKKISSGTSSRADEFLFRDPRMHNLLTGLNECQNTDPNRLLHPKMIRLKDIVRAELEQRPISRILVFTKLRSTVGILVKFLKDDVVKPKKFVGQATKSKTDKGLRQKDQVEILEKFRQGVFNVLVATNVAEEGLDIAECNLVIFYDNSASEIRLIQRMGRTGRSGKGKVVFLYTKGTSDEVSLWAGKRKRAQMRTKLGGAPLKAKTIEKKKEGKPPTQFPTSTVQTSLLTHPPKTKDPRVSNVRIHITPSKQREYQLSSALPVNISPVSVPQTLYDLAVPAKNPFIGIDLVPFSYISINIANLSLFRQITRKKQAVPHFLIFVDASFMKPSEEADFKAAVVAFRDYTGIRVTAFKDHSTLHLTLHTILTTYLKNNPQLK